MKTLALILLSFSLCLVGCSRPRADVSPKFSEDHVPIKPFYVVGKAGNDVIKSHYTLLDSKGYRFYITDRVDKYNIGDSIK